MSKSKIIEVINSEKNGFYIGTRMILPFRCNFIKLIADSHIYTEFVGNKDIKISQSIMNTSIYFRDAGRLNEFEDSYKSIKLILCSEEDDLSIQSNHIKVICHIHADHKVELELPGEDDLFIE